MHRIFCGLLLSGISVAAEEPELVLEHDGFVVIETLAFTQGAVCRKIERYISPVPLAWYTRDTWHELHLVADKTAPDSATERAAPKNDNACKWSIIRHTLVGPLKKGKWRLYGPHPSSATKITPFSVAREIKSQNGAYTFSIEKTAIVRVSIRHYGNKNGGCFEYLPVVFVPAQHLGTADLTVIDVHSVEERHFSAGHGLCRALPQTIAQGAQELPPGNYRIVGSDVSRVTVYATD